MTLSVPFPYAGGKARWAELIWQRLGDPDVYIEAFLGSGACLLARPDGAGRREVVADLNGGVCNFYRAVTRDPDEVAHHADWPTIHQDLTARHGWLRQWFAENSSQLSEDPEFSDARAAGWWVWGISLWIGSEWCGVDSAQVQRDKVPALTGSRVSVGRGIKREHRDELVAWFSAIAARLERVVVLNRDWTSAVTPSMLADTRTSGAFTRAVFLDPPYRDSKDYYGVGGNPAEDSYEWAVEHGERYRIAYCCHAGDFPLPDGWTSAEPREFKGRRNREGRALDVVMFSPACIGEPQNDLLPGFA